MAFDIANHSSIRLNRIAVGQRVILCDTHKRKPISTATLTGWFGVDEVPKTMKNMPETAAILFGNAKAMDGTELHTIELVRAPDTVGAMFLAEEKGEGDQKKIVYRRVTAYEHEDDVKERAASATTVDPAPAEPATEASDEGEKVEE